MIDLTKEIKRESLRRKREREVFRQKVLLIMGTVVIVLVTTLSHILFASAKSVEAITIEELKIEEIPVQKSFEEEIETVEAIETMAKTEEIIEVKETFNETPSSYIYDISEEEVLLFKQIMAAESFSFWRYDEVLSLATVVVNRYESDSFPHNDSFYELLTTDLQFETYSNGRYLEAEITEECDKAVEAVLSGERNLNSDVMYFCTEEYYDVCSSKEFFKKDLDEPVYQVRNVLFFEEP